MKKKRLLSLILAFALAVLPAAADLTTYAEESDHEHSYTAEVTTATCTEGGYTTWICEECGDSYTADETEATGHSYVSEITTAATCTADGVRTYTCEACGDSYTEVIEATGHDWDGNVCRVCGALKESDISQGKITLSTTSYTYNGTKRTPSVKIVVNGTTLVKNTDYTVTYSNNQNAGTAKVTITGTGDYTGKVTKNFTINKKSISKASVTLSTTTYTYNAKTKTPSTTVKLTVNDTKRTLKKGTSYTVSYKNNKAIGTATVTIKGTGNYTGSVKKTFKIVPKKVTVSSAASSRTKEITVKWKKVSGSVKYQIAYRKSGSSTWKYKYVSASTYKKTLTGLSAGKNYKIKVRAYKKVSGKTYYGSWSTTQTVKCKASKIVYLTFDDGPSANMGEILDILDKYNVKATFFVTGNNSKYRYLITEAYNEGHAIGLHSYSHNYSKIYKSKSAFYKDLKKISNLVEDLTGEKSYLLRFPGGSSNTVSRKYCKGIMTTLTKSVTADGYTYFDWNCDSTDASGNNVAVSKIVKNATSSSAKEVNILMHCTDAKDTTVEALPKIIKYYKSKGYDFEVLSSSAYNAHHSVNN